VLLLRWVNPPYSMYMLSEASGPLGSSLYRTWQPIEALPPHVLLAVIAAEDQRFPMHGGFDWGSIREAVDAHRRGGRLRGASTISQQTAKNLFLWHGRSFLRKALEAAFTLALETVWPKHRVLEMYLNIAEWGPGIFGIEAASRSHFGISARQLNREQAALLAAVLPNPRGYSPTRPSETVRMRARWIEQQMTQLGPRWLDPLQLPPPHAPGWSGQPASR
jgi:monofunctional biosynthetic peptidoglycan transglycosylase